MPTCAVSPDLQLHYLVDDFTEPWVEPEAIQPGVVCVGTAAGAAVPGRAARTCAATSRASDAERCAEATLDFIARRGAL